MDISKEYIKMCEKAVEIQRNWLLFGDYYHIKNFKSDYCLFISGNPKKECIWLPRQDQLQDMIWYKAHVSAHGLLTACMHFGDIFYKKINSAAFYNRHIFKTMEQLWLAFVMREKFNKIWNGEDWIKS
jgi:hypothetical protein